MRPELPTRSYVEAWLRARGDKPQPPGRIARWLGAPSEYRFELGPLTAVDTGLCIRHVVFKAYGEGGLLPYMALPRGSRGLFAFDGAELFLLAPEDDSLERLLRREARAPTLAEPGPFAQFICDVRLAGREGRHVVLSSAEQLGSPAEDSELTRQVLDRDEFQRVRASIVPPRIEATADGGAILEFTGVSGGRAGLFILAIQRLRFGPDYTIAVMSPSVLSSRIFSSVGPLT